MQFYKDNPRRISKAQYRRLAADLQEYGDLGGLVHDLNSDQVISGNQRCRVFDLAKIQPVITETLTEPNAQGTVARGYIEWQGERFSYRQVRWTPEQCAAANIKANLDGGGWDWDLLSGWNAADLQSWGMDAETLQNWRGDVGALDKMLEAEQETSDAEPQIDKAEELQKKWQVSTNDIWQLCDGHFVICGDCREPETWRRLLDADGVEKVNGVFTSPPYAEQRKKQYGGVPTDKYVEWWEAVQYNVRANLASNGSFFVNIKPHCEDGQRVLYVFDLVLAMVREWQWRFIEEFAWRNGGIPGTPAMRFKNQFEPIYQYSAGEYKFCPDNAMFISEGAFENAGGANISRHQGGRSTLNHVRTSRGLVYPGNVIECGKSIEQELGHAAAFPVALPSFFIRAYSDAGDVWLDNFAGSGTTGIAAYKEGRRALLIEKLEKYVSVILERYKTQTGIEPVRP
jgi:site-specific DNA-methyltransferase (adenine-specific)